MARRSDRSGTGIPPFLPPSLLLPTVEQQALLAALASESPVCVRHDPRKPGGPGGSPVPWCATGRYLAERPSFTLDPLLHAGAYYVQEASSMLLEQAWSRTGLAGEDILALDLCAAPGGKSTHLASLISSGSLLVCNEVVPARRSALMENLWKQGRANTVITGARAQDLAPLDGTFDLILVDAPCSGEGMFRKDPFARRQWNEGLVRSCARTQRDILPHAWRALKPGGHLIYSTCTWERAENEEQVAALIALGAEHVPIPVYDAWGVAPSDLGLRCYPHRARGEGFFIALLRKPGERAANTVTGPMHGAAPPLPVWLKNAHQLAVHEMNGILHAAPGWWRDVITRLMDTLHVLAPGIPVAEVKGNALRPHPALALNELLAPDVFPAEDLELPHARAFLRGETAIPMATGLDSDNGTRLVRFAGLPLGWMHRAGDRWNNGWPKPWRIRIR